MKNKIVIITFLALFINTGLSFAQSFNNDSFDNMTADLKEAQRQLKQLEQDTKRNFDQIHQNQKYQQLMEDSEDVLKKKWKRDWGKEQNEQELSVNYQRNSAIQVILVLLAAILLYVLLRLILYKKKPAQNGRDLEQGRILVRVGSWIFGKDDLNSLVYLLSTLVDPKDLEYNSGKFKRSFLEDLAITEILTQIAIETKAVEDDETKNKLLSSSDYLKKININNENIKKSIFYYNTRIKRANSSYAEYYRDFLNLLLLLGSKAQVRSFEFFSMSVLVSKLLENIDKRLNAQGDTDRIKREIDALMKDFVTRFEVVVNLEGYL